MNAQLLRDDYRASEVVNVSFFLRDSCSQRRNDMSLSHMQTANPAWQTQWTRILGAPVAPDRRAAFFWANWSRSAATSHPRNVGARIKAARRSAPAA